MTDQPVESLVDLLDIEALEVNLFRGVSPDRQRTRVFGGQVVAQALMAAGRTVPPERSVHSLHGYFLLGGDPLAPIVYEVDRIRDGGSFTTRRVVAVQHGEAIFHLSASFHIAESGVDHGDPMPDVPLPDALATSEEVMRPHLESLPPDLGFLYTGDHPIEIRPVGLPFVGQTGPQPPEQDMWMRARGPLPDDPLLHAGVLTYASDILLMCTAILPHLDPADGFPHLVEWADDFMMASLDHAVWFHRPFRADEWLLYHQTSPSAAGARGLALCSVFGIDGTLVATAMQEGLIRRRRPGRRPTGT
jgi:acyl-CoA thioesterase-2